MYLCLLYKNPLNPPAFNAVVSLSKPKYALQAVYEIPYSPVTTAEKK